MEPCKNFVCSVGTRAGKGQAGAGITIGRAEDTERGAGGWTADDWRCQTEIGGQHAGSPHTVWAWYSGISHFFNPLDPTSDIS